MKPSDARAGGFDIRTPSVARMYDYYLGGKDNFAADRECADEVISRVPLTREIARANRDVVRLLDLSRPVVVVLVAVLLFVPDDQGAYEAMRTLVDAMAPGSCLVVSHVEYRPELEAGAKAYDRANAPAVLRTFEGLCLLAPGLVNVRRWRPDDRVLGASLDPDVPFFGGVAVKP